MISAICSISFLPRLMLKDTYFTPSFADTTPGVSKKINWVLSTFITALAQQRVVCTFRDIAQICNKVW